MCFGSFFQNASSQLCFRFFPLQFIAFPDEHTGPEKGPNVKHDDDNGDDNDDEVYDDDDYADDEYGSGTNHELHAQLHLV